MAAKTQFVRFRTNTPLDIAKKKNNFRENSAKKKLNVTCDMFWRVNTKKFNIKSSHLPFEM